MNSRERQSLRGPVHMITTERRGRSGPHVQEQVFDGYGRLVSLWTRDPDGGERRLNYTHDQEGSGIDSPVAPTPGTRAETEDVSSQSTWSTDALHDVAFGTWGASTARTKLDHVGAPIETVFTNAAGDEVSSIRYACDKDGHVLDAVQYSGRDASPIGAMLAAAADAVGARVEGPIDVLDPGAEQFRVKFTYDHAGLIIVQQIYCAGQRIQQTTNQYNDHLDLQMSIAENDAGRSESRFEYEYDAMGNWTRKTASHAGGNILEVYDRSITYFGE